MLYTVPNKCKAVLDVLLVIPQSIVFASLAGGDVPDLLRSVRGRRFCFRTEVAVAAILCLWVDFTVT